MEYHLTSTTGDAGSVRNVRRQLQLLLQRPLSVWLARRQQCANDYVIAACVKQYRRYHMHTYTHC